MIIIIRRYLRSRGIKSNIKMNPRNRRRKKVGRPYRFDLWVYNWMRSAIERVFSWLKGGFRRIALRYERIALNFLGFVQLACIIIYLRRVFR